MPRPGVAKQRLEFRRHVRRLTVLRTGHGTPAPPHSQASARLLNILNGRSGCVSQTQPVRSQSDDPTLMEEVELQEAAK
jgi:hypothetical protein